MKKATSCNKKARLRDVDLNLSDNEMNIIRKKFIFALKDLQRSDLIF